MSTRFPELDSKAGRTAYERQWYMARLEDPSVLASAVVLDSGLLAVPVGGPRRAGSVLVASADEARRVALLLTGRDGFPAVRVAPPSTERPGEMLVRWGAVPARQTVAAFGEFYGYAHDAIADFLRGRKGVTRDSWQQP